MHYIINYIIIIRFFLQIAYINNDVVINNIVDFNVTRLILAQWSLHITK